MMSTKETPRASTNFPSTGGDVDDGEGEMAVFEQSLQEGEFRAIEANLPRTMSAKITIAGRAKVVQKGMQVYIRLQDLLIRNNRKLEEFYVFMTNSEPVTIVSVFGMPLVDLTIGGGSLACVRENVRGPIDVPLTSLTKYPEELPVRAWGYRYVILALPDQPIRDMPAKVVGYAELEECEVEESKLPPEASKAQASALADIGSDNEGLVIPPNPRASDTYDEMLYIAQSLYEMVGKADSDTVDFATFKIFCDALDVRLLEPQRMKVFEQATLDEQGNVAFEDLALLLTIAVRVKPSPILLVSDVYDMFDTLPLPGWAPPDIEKGYIDDVGACQVLKALNVDVTWSTVQKRFEELDTQRRKLIKFEDVERLFFDYCDPVGFLQSFGLERVPMRFAFKDGRQATEQEAFMEYLKFLNKFEPMKYQTDLEAVTKGVRTEKTNFLAQRTLKAKKPLPEGMTKKQLLELRREGFVAERKMNLYHNREQEASRWVKESTEASEKMKADTIYKAQLDRVRKKVEENKMREKTKEKTQVASKSDKLNISGRMLKTIPVQSIKENNPDFHPQDLKVIDCSHNNIQFLPANILFWAVELRRINASHNEMTEIPDDISSCEKLLLLDLSHNQFSYFPPILQRLGSLKKLAFNHNHLKSVAIGMDTWPQLLQLQLSSNSLVEVLLGPHSMQNLLHLDLSNNKLKALPPTLTDLKKLQSLVVTSNKLTALPEAMGDMVSLENLEVSNNRLISLPSSLQRLEHLKVIEAARNQINKLPAESSHMKALISLNISHNHANILPNDLGVHGRIQALEVRNNELVELPEGLGAMIELQILDAAYNALTSLPKGIGSCVLLRQLDLSHNRLTMKSLPSSIGSLRGLEYCNLSFNQLEDLPPQFGALPAIQYLNVAHNCLERFSTSFVAMKSLKSLDVSSNQIKDFPKHMANMESLTALDASANLISRLPEDIGFVSKLQYLHLYKNRLKNMPLSLGRIFPNLKSFNVGKNPLDELPRKYFSKDVMGGEDLDIRFSKRGHTVATVLKNARDRLKAQAVQGTTAVAGGSRIEAYEAIKEKQHEDSVWAQEKFKPTIIVRKDSIELAKERWAAAWSRQSKLAEAAEASYIPNIKGRWRDEEADWAMSDDVDAVKEKLVSAWRPGQSVLGGAAAVDGEAPRMPTFVGPLPKPLRRAKLLARLGGRKQKQVRFAVGSNVRGGVSSAMWDLIMNEQGDATSALHRKAYPNARTVLPKLSRFTATVKNPADADHVPSWMSAYFQDSAEQSLDGGASSAPVEVSNGDEKQALATGKKQGKDHGEEALDIHIHVPKQRAKTPPVVAPKFMAEGTDLYNTDIADLQVFTQIPMPLIGFGYKTGLFAGDPYSFTKKTTANAKASSTPAVSMPAGQKPVKEAANLAGYSSQDVAEYIRIQASVVPFCDAVWSGGQFSHSLDAFLQRVKDKMGQHYMLAMNPHIYRYYFSAKKEGVAPSFHHLSRDEEERRLVKKSTFHKTKRELLVRVETKYKEGLLAGVHRYEPTPQRLQTIKDRVRAYRSKAAFRAKKEMEEIKAASRRAFERQEEAAIMKEMKEAKGKDRSLKELKAHVGQAAGGSKFVAAAHVAESGEFDQFFKTEQELEEEEKRKQQYQRRQN